MHFGDIFVATRILILNFEFLISMISLTLTRRKTTGKAVTGTLTFPLLNQEEPLTVPTLENADYLIPEGIYPVERTWSPKFKKFLPELIDVPDRFGIRIHRGTIPEHSRGCILLDLAGMANLNILFNQLEIYEIDDTVQLTVRSEQGLETSPS